jgi:hypothetical protein
VKTIIRDNVWTRPTKFTGIVESKNGDKAWYLNGEYHRVDGPALECANGTGYWWLNGSHILETEHSKRTAYLRTTLGKLIFNEHFKLEES